MTFKNTIFLYLLTLAIFFLIDMATLQIWPLLVTVVDLAWGTVLGGTVSCVSAFVGTRLFH